MKAYLQATEIIDCQDAAIQALAETLAKDTINDTQIAKRCFEYVRDEIRHTGDHKDDITTCRASDVLKHKTGWCYAKSHLLAALLRANGIPAGFCYQRLSCDEYSKDTYCLHGLNWIYLREHGWYRVDARGNKEGVDAQFEPPHEKLAFGLEAHEFDLPKNLSEPFDVVVTALQEQQGYIAMCENFPDIINP